MTRITDTEKINEPPIYQKHNFLSCPDELFFTLKNTVNWDERMRARKTASFGVSYDYSQIAYPSTAIPPILQRVCEAIESELGFCPNNCLLNYYLDGNSSMGFHSDSSEELAANTGVAIISLGSVRHIVYRSKDKLAEYSYPLENGSLLYMSQEMQAHWLHAIPKMENVGERISLTFRKIIK
jgi:alkylated DNA repair dioxygenase AlkB